MRREEFEQMSAQQVRVRARNEGQVRRGKPLYFERPWTQVLDEMDDAHARTVGALDAARVDTLHRSVSPPAAGG
jgi:hypothetical protein